MNTPLQIAISPCPNDTFVFDALLHEPSASRDAPSFSYVLHDIERLNIGAQKGEWDIVKISCALYGEIKNEYSLLSAGGAIGMGAGPLLVAKAPIDITSDSLIVVPGLHTTAYKLLRFAYPQARLITEIHFGEIESSVLNEKAHAGVVIHENRFTYQDKGLFKIADLGEIWEGKTGMPVPLGCIVIRRKISESIKRDIEKSIRNSCKKAWSSYPKLSPFVKEHAQNMREDVCRKHIELYVNAYTEDMGEMGKKSIEKLNKM